MARTAAAAGVAVVSFTAPLPYPPATAGAETGPGPVACRACGRQTRAESDAERRNRGGGPFRVFVFCRELFPRRFGSHSLQKPLPRERLIAKTGTRNETGRGMSADQLQSRRSRAQHIERLPLRYFFAPVSRRPSGTFEVRYPTPLVHRASVGTDDAAPLSSPQVRDRPPWEHLLLPPEKSKRPHTPAYVRHKTPRTPRLPASAKSPRVRLRWQVAAEAPAGGTAAEKRVAAAGGPPQGRQAAAVPPSSRAGPPSTSTALPRTAAPAATHSGPPRHSASPVASMSSSSPTTAALRQTYAPKGAQFRAEAR